MVFLWFSYGFPMVFLWFDGTLRLVDLGPHHSKRSEPIELLQGMPHWAPWDITQPLKKLGWGTQPDLPVARITHLDTLSICSPNIP